MKQQKSRLSHTRTLIRREDGRTEVEENGVSIVEPDDVVNILCVQDDPSPRGLGLS